MRVTRIHRRRSKAAKVILPSILVIFGLNRYGQIWKESPQVADNKVVTMRQIYDEKVEEVIEEGLRKYA